MEEDIRIKSGGRRNGKGLENAITLLKYIDELETNKMYGISKCGNITLFTKTEVRPIPRIKKLKEQIHNLLDDNAITRGYQLIIDEYFDKLLED